MAAPMRTVLVDDHNAYRESLRIAASALSPAVRVIGEAACARDAYRALETSAPDLLVLDVLLPDTDGISVLREMRRRGLNVPSLMLTRVSHGFFVRGAFEAGASGYILKDASLEEIVTAMTTVAEGRRYISAAVAASTEGTISAEEVALGELSRREREVFCGLLENKSNKEIAASLCISLRTVERHRFQINRKLGVSSPAQLLHVAAHLGLIASLREPEPS